MFCSKCGTQVEDAARFCRRCGAEQDRTAASVSTKSESDELNRVIRSVSAERLASPSALSPDESVSTPHRSRAKVAGWILVAIAVSLLFVPAAHPAAFLLFWIGFAYVMPGSALGRFASGLIGALIVMAPVLWLRSAINEQGSVVSAGAGSADEVNIKELLSGYEQNEVAADQRFKGRRIRTNGILQDVKKDILGAPYVVVATDSNMHIPSVQCSLTAAAVQEAARLTPGAFVTVEGRVNGLLVNVHLTDCSFVSRPSPTPPTAASGSVQPSTVAAGAPSAVSPAPNEPSAAEHAEPAAAPAEPEPDIASELGGNWHDIEGANSSRVRELLGAPSLMQKQSGGETWYYDGTRLGTVRVYFANDVASLHPPK